MKVATNVKPKKGKKVVGFTTKTKAGEVVQKGSRSVELKAELPKDKYQKTYTPTKIETGHPAYGKPGGGTDKEMNKLIGEAQAKKKDVTEYSSKGLHYKAGETRIVSKDPEFSVKTDIKPTIRKVEMVKTPIYEKGASSGGKLKARAVTLGGSTKGDHPATKFGSASNKRVTITRVKKGRV